MQAGQTMRLATSADEPALWEMLSYAASMTEPDAITFAMNDPYLSTYVADFGRGSGDFGIVGLENDAVVGAAWVRLGRSRGPHATGTDTEPELAIGVRPAARGAGLGSRLLGRLLAEADFPAITLSVRSTNPSVRLYERHGFSTIRATVNRVGGESLVMRRARILGA